MNILAMMQRIQESLGSCPGCGAISNGKPTECFELCELKAAIDDLKSGRLVVVEKESEEIHYRPLKYGDVIKDGDECYANEFGPWTKVGKSTVGKGYYPWNGESGHHVAMRRKTKFKKEQRE